MQIAHKSNCLITGNQEALICTGGLSEFTYQKDDMMLHVSVMKRDPTFPWLRMICQPLRVDNTEERSQLFVEIEW